jgi:hypothetical protein
MQLSMVGLSVGTGRLARCRTRSRSAGRLTEGAVTARGWLVRTCSVNAGLAVRVRVDRLCGLVQF